MSPEPITGEFLERQGFDELQTSPDDCFRIFRHRMWCGLTLEVKVSPAGTARMIVMPTFVVSYANSPSDLLRQIDFIAMKIPVNNFSGGEPVN